MLKKEPVFSVILPLTALIFTFGVASSQFNFFIKIILFTLILSTFLFFQIGIRLGVNKRDKKGYEKTLPSEEKEIFTAEIKEKLLILEEANKFFGASLKSADMFLLVTSRIKQFVDFDAGVLFCLNDQNKMEIKFVTGLSSNLFKHESLSIEEGLAGQAFLSKKVETDPVLKTEKAFFRPEILKNFNSAISIPLLFAGEVFAVLNLYSSKSEGFDETSTVLAEALGERIAPLLKSSFTFEKSLSNALVDSLTNLPNERAFFLVLENQIAEAQRFQSRRDLTVLAVDIKNFSALNGRFGHTTGDKILAFVSQLIRGQLREMDFLARSQNDEFLIILPTANRKTAQNIIQRISRAFERKPFFPDKKQKQIIELNFGTATFDQDGETSNHLFRASLANKRKSKEINNGSVIKFPGQFIN